MISILINKINKYDIIKYKIIYYDKVNNIFSIIYIIKIYNMIKIKIGVDWIVLFYGFNINII